MNYAVILAGGVGSRFWPFSRELEPKQFLKIAGKESLLQDTILRLDGLIDRNNTFIITNKAHFYELKKQIEKYNIPEENILLEPEGKNTAPAIGLCARLLSLKDKNALLIVLPADHFVENKSGFVSTIKKAINCAKNGNLVTIGIKPTKPSTGYGYIKIKKCQSVKVSKRQKNFYEVEKFLEKPNIEKATKYFKNKDYFWNSGIFIWKADCFLEELRKYLPQLHSLLSLVKHKTDIEKVWHKITPISVDYGIMEHSKRIALVPSKFFWTDLGSWDALNEILPKNKEGNIIRADVLNHKSSGICVISRSDRLISTIGLKDLIIADTDDALLVCDKYMSQDVKKIVDQLKLSKRKEHFVHTVEKRPWGNYKVLQIGNNYKIKIIEIEPKKRLSLQRHKKRAEHWVVVAGVAKVTSGKKTKIVRCNESIFIPKGMKHRLENPGKAALKIVEVQTGNYLEEDDIERFDDDFKR